ncbi:MAG: DUF3443 family protein [Candidatus Acidiferrales bacterium]
MSRNPSRAFIALLSCALLLWSVGCSGSGAPPTTTPPTPPPSPTAPTGPNVAAITVNTGPAASTGSPYVNGGFTSVTVCSPGSTSKCQTINGILVDTGSYGLRILSSALTTVSLNQQTDSSGNPIVECAPFASGFTWGPVQTADLTISGEAAKSVPIQVLGSPNYPDTGAPTTPSCSDGSTFSGLDSLAALGANGILGVGLFAQDCGNGCTLTGVSNTGYYFSCPGGSDTNCAVTSEALSAQVVNPVVMFPVDNNGVIVELPAVPADTVATSITGYLIFGIGTESNNGMGSATVYSVDPTSGNFSTEFEGLPYTDSSFLDSGSDALYFDPTNTDLVNEECADLDDEFYCPTSPEAFSATNEGFSNGTSGQVNFTVANADSFFDNQADNSDGVFNGLAGPFSGVFDWGLPFFYGLNVYTAIDGQNTPAGVGPFWAY